MDDMISAKKYENPRNEKDFKLAKVVFPSFLLIALTISVISSNLAPLIVGTIFVAISWAIQWYNFDHTRPASIAISDEGFTMIYRKKKSRSVQWHEVKDMFRSHVPNSVSQATIRFHRGGKAEVTHEIANIIERGYAAKMGMPVKPWDGRSW